MENQLIKADSVKEIKNYLVEWKCPFCNCTHRFTFKGTELPKEPIPQMCNRGKEFNIEVN